MWLLHAIGPRGWDIRNTAQVDRDDGALGLNPRPRQTLAWQTARQALVGALRLAAD